MRDGSASVCRGNGLLVTIPTVFVDRYFSMLERSIPLDIAYSVHQLKFDARRAANQLLEVQEAAGKSDMDVEEMDPCEALKLVKLHNTLQDLRNQYRIYETPLLL